MDETSQSILDFLRQTEDADLHKKWREMLERKCISDQLRVHSDSWFLDCYKQRKQLHDLKLVSLDVARTKAEELYLQLDPKDSLDKMLLQQWSEDLDIEAIVKIAISCVEEEIKLMEHFKKKDELKKEAENQQRRNVIDKQVTEAKEAFQELYAKCRQWDQKNDRQNALIKQLEDLEQHLAEASIVKEASKKQKNGVKKYLADIDKKAEVYKKEKDCSVQLIQMKSEVQTLREEISSLFKWVPELFESVKQCLCIEVENWRKNFKHWYVELGDKPDHDELAIWCRILGQTIFDTFTLAHDWVGNNPECEEVEEKLDQILIDFYQSTFIVTEQDGYIVKVDKKNLPKFTVRILAADAIPLNFCMEAYFLLEDDINGCFINNQLDAKKMNESGTKLDHSKRDVKVTLNRNASRCEAVYKDLQFKDKKFNRPGKKPVHDEKFRVVFHATINETAMSTLSLPLVVTTGANQNCLALASTMWQCFSTDVFKIPIQPNTVLPWSKVADMLQMKMLKLCSKRGLSPENIHHLKRRLLGEDDLPDDAMVTFKRFSEDPLPLMNRMGECSFSFWKWFLANYNLLEKYMLSYWKDGLIEGYLSKEDVERKLKEARSFNNGVFILRFSDNNIVNSQGIKSVFGTLTASVQIMSEEHGEKVKKVSHLDLGGHTKQKEKTLANILKDTYDKDSRCSVFQYVYPSLKSRAETFDKYIENTAIVEGYTGVKDQFVVDLEQAMEKLKISTGKHRSPSGDSDTFQSTPGAVSNKRTRNSADQFPVMRTMLETSHGGPPSVEMSDSDAISNVSSPLHAMSPPSDCRMQLSHPDELTQHQQFNDFSIDSQDPPCFPCIPTVVQQVFTQVQPVGSFDLHTPSCSNEVEVSSNQEDFSQPNLSWANSSWSTGSLIVEMDNSPDDFMQQNNSSGNSFGVLSDGEMEQGMQTAFPNIDLFNQENM